MARRIHIVGASGSGCTTLGRALAERLGWVHLDTDTYFWLPTDPPFQMVREGGERRALLGADLERHAAWTLTGSLSGWGDVFVPLFDLVVFLWIPPEVRLARLMEREISRYGTAALAPGGKMHETHVKFMDWAALYDTADASIRSKARHEEWLRTLPCPVVRLEGVQTVEEHVGEVIRQIERREQTTR